MAGSIPAAVLEIVESARQREETEFARAAQIEANRVIVKTATGTGDIDHAFSLQRCFRLVFVRCHFGGAMGTDTMHIDIDSVHGSAYDTRLTRILSAGMGTDVNYRVPSEELRLPSPWSFQPGDAIHIRWTNPNPGSMTWGLEVGLAPA
ncbi:MAG TPA: hypothetical protein VM243_14110 [Phycisphaerae bacterium]|nr:hypothetical protein [Phycisphaerae bacterium]